MTQRMMVLSLLAVVLAGVVALAEPINAVLRSGDYQAVAEVAQVQPSGTPPVANKPTQAAPGGIRTAPAFAPARDPLRLQPYDRVLGLSGAPITVIEYASLTCTHCHDFALKTLPSVQQDWIATGKVRYVLRDLPWDNLALGMAVTARCAPAQSYYPLIAQFFQNQMAIYNANDKIGAIAGIANMAGLSRSQVEACVKNADWQALSNGMKADGVTKLKITGTPTFFINGTKLEGYQDYPAFKAALQKALAAAQH